VRYATKNNDVKHQLITFIDNPENNIVFDNEYFKHNAQLNVQNELFLC
jgi:hypothetical protein